MEKEEIEQNNAQIIMWRELPPELRVNILTRLSLPTLRALKRLGRAMANDCRRTIRSEEWQGFHHLNSLLLEAEVSSCVNDLKLPLKVSVLDDRFRGRHRDMYVRSGDEHLLATIHRMSILCIDENGDRMVLTPGSSCEAWSDMKEDNFRFYLTDLCVEVHGHGIVSSELGLRMLLDRIIQERGVRLCPVRRNVEVPKRVADMHYDYDKNGHYEGYSLGYDHLKLPRLLDEMCIVTEVAQGKYCHHECTYDEYVGRLYSVWEFMRQGLGPFA